MWMTLCRRVGVEAIYIKEISQRFDDGEDLLLKNPIPMISVTEWVDRRLRWWRKKLGPLS
jgi:hypothetical protein